MKTATTTVCLLFAVIAGSLTLGFSNASSDTSLAARYYLKGRTTNYFNRSRPSQGHSHHRSSAKHHQTTKHGHHGARTTTWLR